MQCWLPARAGVCKLNPWHEFTPSSSHSWRVRPFMHQVSHTQIQRQTLPSAASRAEMGTWHQDWDTGGGHWQLLGANSQIPNGSKHTAPGRWEHGGDRTQGLLQGHQSPAGHTPALWIATMTCLPPPECRDQWPGEPPQLTSRVWGCCQSPPEPGWLCGHPESRALQS